MDVSLFRRTQISSHSYLLTSWAAGKSDCWWHLYLLSVLCFVFFSDPKADVSWNAETPPSLPWSDVHLASTGCGKKPEKTDEPLNKDSIFNVWSPTKNDKSQRPTATRCMCKHSQPGNITIQPCNPNHLISVLAQHRLVGRKRNVEM